MEIIIQQDGNMRKVVIGGDLTTTGELDYLKEVVRGELRSGQRNFSLDLSQVHRISSIALGTLVSLLRLIRLHGGDMVLFNPRDTIARIFKITNLDTIFTICPSDEDVHKSSPV